MRAFPPHHHAPLYVKKKNHIRELQNKLDFDYRRYLYAGER